VSVAAALWAANVDLAEQALRHPFVRGIASGELARADFVGYIAQDATFLESFARAYALALAKAPDAAGVAVFADLITGVRDELRLHAGVAQRWGVDMTSVVAAPATLAYTDFLLATAAIGGPGTICAAMTPCMRLYAYLGTGLADGPVAEAYAECVATYSDPGFDALAGTLESLLDRYVSDAAEVAGVYRRAMRLELAFFDAAYSGDGVGGGWAGLPGG
jgi:thiaminase/transcriptional activator TenA